MDLGRIHNIRVVPQKRISVEGGDVLHVINSTEPEFKEFNEAYFSIVKANFIKAWKRHRKMTMNLIVPIGRVQFIFYNGSGELILNTTIGEDNYCRITVPPKIWFGFKGLAKRDSYILNVADIPHDPLEVDRKPLIDFNFLPEER